VLLVYCELVGNSEIFAFFVVVVVVAVAAAAACLMHIVIR
jgi:hypothetical protein